MELFVSICAVIVAISALAVSIYQGKHTKKHNMLSVKPYLHFETNNLSLTEPFRLFIKNAGIGPAIITKMSVSIDREPINQSDPLLYYLATIKANEIVKSNNDIISKTSFINGETALLPGEHLLLLELGRKREYNSHELKLARDHLIDSLNRLNIVITYESMYGNEDKLFTEQLQEHT